MRMQESDLDSHARRESDIDSHGKEKTRRGYLRGPGRRLIISREGILLVLVTALVVFLSLTSPVFMTRRNIATLLSQTSMTAIAAFAMTALITVGEVDLSIGSLQAFIGVVTMLALNSSHSFLTGIGVGLGAGAVVGLLNSSLVLGLHISSFVVTLAMLFVLRGLTVIVSNASVQNTHHIVAFGQIGNGFIAGVPWPVAIAVVVFLFFHVLLNHTILGRHIYVTGGNQKAAFMAGIRVSGVRTLCFVLTSMFAALSAIILLSRMNSGEPKVGQGFEFQTLAAVLLGRSAMNGGAGSLVGTLLAVLLLGLLGNGIVLLDINSSWQPAALGILIFIAIWADGRQRRNFEA